MKIKGNRWAVFIAGYACVFAIALTNVWSVFVNPLVAANGWEKSNVLNAYAYYSLVMAVFGIVSAKLIQRFPTRGVLYFGSACMAVGLLGTGLVKNISGLYLMFSVLFAIGGGCTYNLSITNTLKWFPDKKGLVSGLLLSGASLGGMVFAPVMNGLFTKYGVRTACIIMACVFAVYLGLTVWMAQAAPEGYRPEGWEPPAVKAGTTGGRDFHWTEMVKTPLFYLIFFLFISANTGSAMMISSASVIGQSYAGLSAAAAATAVGTMSCFNFVGRMFFGWLSDRIGRYNALMISVSVCTCVMIMLFLNSSPTVFIGGMCLTGMCGGSILALLPSICSDAFGTKNSTMNYSILFLGFAGSSFLAPRIAAKFAGNYSLAFLTACGLCVAGLVLLCCIKSMIKKSIG
ncbi:MAG: OFA family MFS transporter [Lachnospiraceae bacterium]|nr:OFA family MFS transporter [Lachnospiraceae bacterium]